MNFVRLIGEFRETHKFLLIKSGKLFGKLKIYIFWSKIKTNHIKFILYVGGPGTGKTTRLKKLAEQGAHHIISPTNLNAQHTGGTTIYKYCGCSYTKFIPKKFTAPTILIDEVFMFSAGVFKQILQCCNESTVEVICFGDPYQISPPSQKDNIKNISAGDDYFYNAIPENIEIKVCQLNVYFRSIGDKNLQQLLMKYRETNELRKTKLMTILPVLNKKEVYCKIVKERGLVLTGTHEYAKSFCDTKLLKGDVQILQGADGVNYFRGERIFIVNQHSTILQEVQLKNIDVSGQLLVEDNNECEKFICAKLQKNQYKYPVIKGDAVVINLVQGLEFAEIPIIIDIDSFFAFGSIYTAISRVKRLSQLFLFVRDKKEKIFQPDLQNIYINH